MKKVLILFPILALLITGCSLTQKPVVNNSASNQPISSPEEQNNKQIINQTQPQNVDSFSVLSDKKLFDGSFYIEYNSWSPSSDKFFVTRYVGMTDIGLPEYQTIDIFDLNQKFLGKTNIQDGLVSETPFWINNTTLITKNEIVNINDVKNITFKDNESQTPPGYNLLEEMKYYNSNTKENEKSLYRLTFSPDKKFVAFFSAYGSEDGNPRNLFIMPQGAKSLSELVNFGSVNVALESSAPIITWSRNGKFLITGNNELFDVINQKDILPGEADGNSHIRRTYLSSDESKVLVISNFQDRRNQQDYDHEIVRIFIKNLSNAQETEILSAEGSEDTITHLDGGFSPDGKFIVFNSNKQLWIANVVTGEKKQLTSEAKNYSQPRWSSDGKKIVYSLPEQEVRLIELGN